MEKTEKRRERERGGEDREKEKGVEKTEKRRERWKGQRGGERGKREREDRKGDHERESESKGAGKIRARESNNLSARMVAGGGGMILYASLESQCLLATDGGHFPFTGLGQCPNIHPLFPLHMHIWILYGYTRTRISYIHSFSQA